MPRTRPERCASATAAARGSTTRSAALGRSGPSLTSSARSLPGVHSATAAPRTPGGRRAAPGRTTSSIRAAWGCSNCGVAGGARERGGGPGVGLPAPGQHRDGHVALEGDVACLPQHGPGGPVLADLGHQPVPVDDHRAGHRVAAGAGQRPGRRAGARAGPGRGGPDGRPARRGRAGGAVRGGPVDVQRGPVDAGAGPGPRGARRGRGGVEGGRGRRGTGPVARPVVDLVGLAGSLVGLRCGGGDGVVGHGLLGAVRCPALTGAPRDVVAGLVAVGTGGRRGLVRRRHGGGSARPGARARVAPVAVQRPPRCYRPRTAPSRAYGTGCRVAVLRRVRRGGREARRVSRARRGGRGG